MKLEQEILNEIIQQAQDLMSDWNAGRNMQKRFIIEYIKENFTNATAAVIKAGYSEKSASKAAHKLMNQRHIQDVLYEVQNSFENRSLELSIASSIEIKQYLTQVMRGEITNQVLINTGWGEQGITNIQVTTMERIRAAELLGKSMKLWTDRVEHLNNVPIFIDNLDELED